MKDEVFHWLIPALKVVLGDEKEIYSKTKSKTTAISTSSIATTIPETVDSSVFLQKLELIPLFTRAIICLLGKTKCLDLNPKEMQRKCLVGMQGSPQWKHMYREFFQHKIKGVDCHESSVSLQHEAMKSVFNTFLMISTNASRVTGDTFRFIEGWVQLGIFHQSTVDEFYSNFNLLEQQKCIDDRVKDKFEKFACSLHAAHKVLCLRSEDAISGLMKEMRELGFGDSLSRSLGFLWRRNSGLSKPER